MQSTSPELDTLLEQLDLERLDTDLFLGNPGDGKGRLFGGMVLAQTVMAAYQTVEDASVHSLHSYFVRPGRHGAPIRFLVNRIRDGRTFTTRDVVAYQGGEAIFQASLSFTRPDEGVDEHQAAMPEAPGPDGLESWGWPGIDRANDDERQRWLRKRPVDIRDADTDGSLRAGEIPRRKVWIRMRGQLPESEAIHAAAIAYATDSGLLSTARGVNAPGRRASASLDHSVWFHHPPRFGDWLLYTSENPIAHAARALIFGQMHRADGTHVVSVVQEGLIRAPREK